MELCARSATGDAPARSPGGRRLPRSIGSRGRAPVAHPSLRLFIRSALSSRSRCALPAPPRTRSQPSSSPSPRAPETCRLPRNYTIGSGPEPPLSRLRSLRLQSAAACPSQEGKVWSLAAPPCPPARDVRSRARPRSSVLGSGRMRTPRTLAKSHDRFRAGTTFAGPVHPPLRPVRPTLPKRCAVLHRTRPGRPLRMVLCRCDATFCRSAESHDRFRGGTGWEVPPGG